MLGIGKAKDTVQRKITTPINAAVVFAALALTVALVALLLAVASAH